MQWVSQNKFCGKISILKEFGDAYQRGLASPVVGAKQK